ncbi:MAG TPA: alpha-galactosidase [Opitutus sp.]|nr:alpha-galactosidase [Opitutus sp.]
MMTFARNAWAGVVLLAAVAGVPVRGETVNSAGAASVGFDPREGARWSLSVSGKPILASAPLFHVVADGVGINHWLDASTKFTNEDGVLKVSGSVAGVPDLKVTAEIARVAGATAWECRLTLRNTGATEIVVTRADAFVGRLEGDWRGHAFSSQWGEEWEPAEFAVDTSRDFAVHSGRSSMGWNPWLGLQNTEVGAVVIAPVWSGNWHIDLEPTDSGETFVAAGISPWKFSYTLRAGAGFEAPSVLIAFGADLNEASVALTRAVAKTLPRSDASEALPVEWNPWWPYEDKDINEDIFLANVDVGSRLGIEVSTLDAGWFGASDATTAWWDIRGDFAHENRARFPHGIAWLADETRRRGQKFGIWLELEAVGLKAKLRSEQPELLARRDVDPPAEPLDPADPGFLGYICLGSQAGRVHARNLLESLVEKTRCEWLKLDFNLDPKAGCSRTDHDHGAGDGLYAHYRGLYALLDEFRAAHPDVIVEACSAGGLRIDAGLLRHVHCVFLSDPDWTRHHLQVVHGTSRLLPPAAMLHWAMSEFRWKHPKQTLDLRDPALTQETFDALVRAAFMHRFGISWRLPDLPERWRERLARHIEVYQREVRPFVRGGDLRRLTETPRRDGSGEQQPAFQLSVGDRHLLIAISLEPATHGMIIRPMALHPERRYRLRSLDFGAAEAAPSRTGADWMSEGLPRIQQQSFIGVLEPVSRE